MGCGASSPETRTIGSAGAIVADMLLRQGCPVTRLSLKRTAIGAEAVERLLRSPRLRAIELSELPLYGVDEVRRERLRGGPKGRMQGRPCRARCGWRLSSLVLGVELGREGEGALDELREQLARARLG